MLSLVLRYSLIGALVMIGVFVTGLGCRYFFVAPNLAFSPRVFVMMLVGTVAYGLGMPLLMTRSHSKRFMVSLLKTLLGAISLTAIIALSTFIWKALVAPIPSGINYADLVAMIGIFGVTGGLGLFYVDRTRKEQ